VIPKSRVEAFSDGVIAIAITLLVLDLHVPEPAGSHTLGHRLTEQWPSYAAYVVSFMTIGIIWLNHAAMLRRVVTVDHAILFRNLVLLMTIAALPFPTALMATYLRESDGEKLAAAAYGGSLLVMSLAFFSMQRHLMRVKVHLLHEKMTPDVRQAIMRRNAIGLFPYAVATAAALATPYLTLAICAAVAAFYALPATTSERSS
jgi:TMEM175 potassium channel family protein